MEKVFYKINKLIYIANPHNRYIHKHINKFKSMIGSDTKLIIDIGGGNSPYHYIFSSIGAEYVSTDVRPYPELDVISDATKLPYKSSIADIVLLIEVLEHIYDTKEVIRGIYRILKPEGYLICTVPFIIGNHDAIDYHRFTEEHLKKLMKDNGFEIIELKKRGGIFSSISGLLCQIPNSVLINKYLSVLFYFLILPIILLLPYLDLLDKKQDVTLGYSFIAKKINNFNINKI